MSLQSQDKVKCCIRLSKAVGLNAAPHYAHNKLKKSYLKPCLPLLQSGDRADAAFRAGNGGSRECGRASLSHGAVC